MNYFEAIILGIIQGITEFLPVSSSGHLFLINKLNIMQTEVSLFYNIMLHLGSLMAVIIIFWNKVKFVIKNPFSDLTKHIIVASIPTVIIVGFLRFFFKNALEGSLLPLGFAITTVFLFSTKFITPKQGKVNNRSAIVVGIAQGLAALPGISRSGSTIASAQLLGVNREDSGNFSFLISIPIIIGSSIFESLSISKADFEVNILVVIIGAIFAFISGFLALKVLISVIRESKLHYFGYYTLVLTIFSFFLI